MDDNWREHEAGCGESGVKGGVKEAAFLLGSMEQLGGGAAGRRHGDDSAGNKRAAGTVLEGTPGGLADSSGVAAKGTLAAAARRKGGRGRGSGGAAGSRGRGGAGQAGARSDGGRTPRGTGGGDGEAMAFDCFGGFGSRGSPLPHAAPRAAADPTLDERYEAPSDQPHPKDVALLQVLARA